MKDCEAREVRLFKAMTIVSVADESMEAGSGEIESELGQTSPEERSARFSEKSLRKRTSHSFLQSESLMGERSVLLGVFVLSISGGVSRGKKGKGLKPLFPQQELYQRLSQF